MYNTCKLFVHLEVNLSKKIIFKRLCLILLNDDYSLSDTVVSNINNYLHFEKGFIPILYLGSVNLPSLLMCFSKSSHCLQPSETISIKSHPILLLTPGRVLVVKLLVVEPYIACIL